MWGFTLHWCSSLKISGCSADIIRWTITENSKFIRFLKILNFYWLISSSQISILGQTSIPQCTMKRMMMRMMKMRIISLMVSNCFSREIYYVNFWVYLLVPFPATACLPNTSRSLASVSAKVTTAVYPYNW